MNRNSAEGVRWLEQGMRDLEDARILAEAGSYASACFHCQQAAEKALKGFLYSKGLRAILTHSVTRLMEECSKFENFPSTSERPMGLVSLYTAPRNRIFIPRDRHISTTPRRWRKDV
ncbi:TPA: HEPN domain-containing protein [Candidatus Poribacteria bacterium]|nr:HEPN domain-containing protein [Candidatus Poribacteria bacterium]HEX31029.1 HEPN domain-containing protein [Candidatus Poribacteria bacterium]